LKFTVWGSGFRVKGLRFGVFDSGLYYEQRGGFLGCLEFDL
jgi:hypothetical protein